MEKSKKGPKPDPNKVGFKQFGIRCREDQIEYLRWWVLNRGIVPNKPWGVKK
jgi:hypothetical protein